MRWLVVVLLVVNFLLVVAAANWSPPGKLDVDGGRGTLPRVSDLKIDRTVEEGVAKPKQLPQAGASDYAPDPVLIGPPCGSIEGFSTEVLAEAFSRAHRRWLARYRVTKRAIAGPAYHWVLIPPLDSRAAALKRLEELQRGGIDSFLVTRGAFRNAISLGLFESEKLAQDLNARFQSRNVETVLVNTDRNQISYALVFAAASKAEFDLLVEAARRDAEDLKTVKDAACEGVASPDKNP